MQDELAQHRARVEILQACLLAAERHGEFCSAIFDSEDRVAALRDLQERFALSETQAAAVLDLRFAALTRSERTWLAQEVRDRNARIAELGDE